MNKALTLWLKLITAAGFFVCAAWAWKHPDYEPIAATLGCLGTFVGLFIVERNYKPEMPSMRQHGGRKSKNYQSGGDMTINPKK